MFAVTIELPKELMELLRSLPLMEAAWADGARTSALAFLAAAVVYLLWRNKRDQ